MSEDSRHGFILALILTVLLVRSAIAGVIQGTVYDRETGNPIPYATVRVEITGQSMPANQEGGYRLQLAPGNYGLKFSHVGYYSEQQAVVIGDSAIRQDVHLRPAVIEVPGINVFGGDYNAAERIILEAIARKRQLLAEIEDYSFEAYTKLVVWKENKDTAKEMFLISENQLKSYWQQPNKYKEVVIAQKKSANLKEADIFVTPGELLNFNKNRLEFGPGVPVVSPTAVDALEYYSYSLLDTLYIDLQPVFRISIEPKTETVPLFCGDILIVDSSFAVIGVDLYFNKGFDMPYMINPHYVEQCAEFGNRYWMPIEIRFTGEVDIPLPGIPHLSFQWVAALHKYNLNVGQPKGTFGEYQLEIAENVDEFDSATWNDGQLVPLTPEEIGGYQRLDSLSRQSKPLYKRAILIGLAPIALLTGGGDSFRFNRVEGAYLGGKVRLTPLRRAELELKAGYATAARIPEYGSRFKFTLSESQKLFLQFRYSSTVRSRPTMISQRQANYTFSALLFKVDPLDYYRERGFEVSLGCKLINQTRLTIGYRHYLQRSIATQTDYSLFDMDKKHRPNPAIADGDLRSLFLTMHYDSRKLMRYKNRDEHLLTSSYTLFDCGLETADPGLIDNDFDYLRYFAQLYRRQQTPGLGETQLLVAAGWTEGSLPPQRFFAIDHGSWGFKEDIGFKTLNETNFIGDRAFAIYFFHDFGRRVFQRSGLPLMRKIPLSLHCYGGSFWSELKDHRLMPDEGIQEAARFYSELGFGFGQITPLRLRLYFTWQLSEYATDSFSFELGFGF